MGSISNVQEMVDAVIYLTEASHVTGEMLHVDGGAHIANGNRRTNMEDFMLKTRIKEQYGLKVPNAGMAFIATAPRPSICLSVSRRSPSRRSTKRLKPACSKCALAEQAFFGLTKLAGFSQSAAMSSWSAISTTIPGRAFIALVAVRPLATLAIQKPDRRKQAKIDPHLLEAILLVDLVPLCEVATTL
jgi:hypothetical protein